MLDKNTSKYLLNHNILSTLKIQSSEFIANISFLAVI